MKKMFKSAVAIILAVVMVFGSVPLGALTGLTDWLEGLTVTADATSYSGACGDNLTWALNRSTGVLTISGIGDMYDWTARNKVPWFDYNLMITSVSIGDGVTSIGGYALILIPVSQVLQSPMA